MLFRGVGVKCWVDGAKGDGCARSGVDITRWGDVKAGESGQRVG